MNAWLRLAIIICEVYGAMALFLALFCLAVKNRKPSEDEGTELPEPKRYVRHWTVYLG